MKIAQVVCVWPPYKGGIGSSAKKISEQLAEAGHDVTVFTPDYGDSKTVDDSNGNLKVCRLQPFLKYGNGGFFPQLCLKLNDFDIIYLHYPFFGASEVVLLASFFCRKKLVIQYHMDVQTYGLFTRLLSFPSIILKPFLLNRADKIITASMDYIENSSIKKIYERYPQKFEEIPFGVDTEKFHPTQTKTDNEILKILFVGGLDKAHYFKGVNVLLQALSKLNNKNWLLQIVGVGDLKNNYEIKADDLGIRNQVHFLGKCEKSLPEIYKNADLFVLPSINRNEAFGIVLLEAMSSGLPVIASDLPGVRKVFEDRKQGLLAQPGNSDDLKNKIEMILCNKEHRLIMGQEARKLVLKKYASNIIEKLIINSVKSIS